MHVEIGCTCWILGILVEIICQLHENFLVLNYLFKAYFFRIQIPQQLHLGLRSCLDLFQAYFFHIRTRARQRTIAPQQADGRNI